MGVGEGEMPRSLTYPHPTDPTVVLVSKQKGEEERERSSVLGIRCV